MYSFVLLTRAVESFEENNFIIVISSVFGFDEEIIGNMQKRTDLPLLDKRLTDCNMKMLGL